MHPRALLDSLDIGVAAISADGTVSEWTDTAARLTGIPADGIVGRNFWLAFPNASSGHVEEALRAVRADGVARTVVYPSRAPGETFEFRVTMGPGDDLVVGFQVTRELLAPQTRAAQLLSAFEVERRLYMQLFSTLPVPALVLDATGQILQVNDRAGELFGTRDPAALLGKPLADRVPASHRLALDVALREAATASQQLTLPIELPGGGHQEARAVLLNVDPQAQPPRLLFIAVETSREALLQRKLLQADRLAQLGALVAGVAHELSNPLAAIAAFGETLALDPRDPEVRGSAEIIRAEALRAGRIVGTLLDFARQRPRVRQPLDLSDLAHRVLALERSALRRARIRASLEIPRDLPVVVGDPPELQQVLLNAVVNSCQAIATTGEPGTILISARMSDGRVMLRVDDSGPGVPPEIIERVFDPFFSTKGEGGSGLGLSISLGLVRSMGGRIWMQNIQGGGTSLMIELPVGSEAPPQPGSAEPEPPGRRLTVLVVDDEPSVRRGLALLAKRLGHQVDSAASLEEALRLAAARDEGFDAFLVDVHLDEAHTGFELFDALAREGRAHRVVFTTGDSISSGTRDQLERAARPVLRKPFGLNDLRQVLDRVALHGEAHP